MLSEQQGLEGIRTTPETERAQAAIVTLQDAIAAAQAGDHQRGRELCASVLFDIQPMLQRRKGLLRTAICALLVSQGFKLLTRVVVTLSGRRIRVVLQFDGTDQIALPRCQDEPHETIYTVDPRWLARLSVDDPFLQGWCEALAGGQASYNGRPAPRRARLSPEVRTRPIGLPTA